MFLVSLEFTKGAKDFNLGTEIPPSQGFEVITFGNFSTHTFSTSAVGLLVDEHAMMTFNAGKSEKKT
jgi:hypothetical protein